VSALASVLLELAGCAAGIAFFWFLPRLCGRPRRRRATRRV